jgi:hypothetical protein
VAAAGGRVGVSLNQRSVDGFQHAQQVLVHIAIPKSKYKEAAFLQLLIACWIGRPMRIDVVLTAV